MWCIEWTDTLFDWEPSWLQFLVKHVPPRRRRMHSVSDSSASVCYYTTDAGGCQGSASQLADLSVSGRIRQACFSFRGCSSEDGGSPRKSEPISFKGSVCHPPTGPSPSAFPSPAPRRCLLPLHLHPWPAFSRHCVLMLFTSTPEQAVNVHSMGTS